MCLRDSRDGEFVVQISASPVAPPLPVTHTHPGFLQNNTAMLGLVFLQVGCWTPYAASSLPSLSLCPFQRRRLPLLEQQSQVNAHLRPKIGLHRLPLWSGS